MKKLPNGRSHKCMTVITCLSFLWPARLREVVFGGLLLMWDRKKRFDWEGEVGVRTGSNHSKYGRTPPHQHLAPPSLFPPLLLISINQDAIFQNQLVQDCQRVKPVFTLHLRRGWLSHCLTECSSACSLSWVQLWFSFALFCPETLVDPGWHKKANYEDTKFIHLSLLSALIWEYF